jgi:hypothetical protein
VRFVIGTAVYTSNFPRPTAPLSPITNTSLLTCQNPTIIDNSTNAFTITNSGTATVLSSQLPFTSPFVYPKSSILNDGTYRVGGSFDEYTMPTSSYSVSFNGTSQYLIATSNAAFAFPGDFTFEGWFYKLTAWTNTMDLVQGNGTGGISFYSAASTLRSGPNNVSSYSLGSSTGIPTNAWVHIAFVRKSNSARIYVNGVPLAAAVSDTNSYSQTALYIGGGVDGYFDGYMSNVRVVKGTAIYDPTLSSFTPPIGPLTAIAGTSLLTCQNSTIVDNSGNNIAITNTGTATTSNTTTPTFARSSLVNDGTLKTFGIVDEFTGNPIADSSLMVWLDPTQGSSYNGTGSSWNDLTTNAKTYTLFNTPTFSSSTNGGVITFTGASSQYAQHATTLFNSTTFNTYTMNLWVYPTGAGNIISVCGQSTINTGYHYSGIEITAGGLISFGQWTGSMTTIATSQQTLNQWYNLVITYNGTTATAYVNGTSVGSSAIAWSSPGASTFFALMATDSTNMGTTGYASGSIGSFMAYNRGLTADEVVQNYNATRKRYALPYTYSVLFNGSSQYLTAPYNAVFNFSTSDFTIEEWIYPTSFADYRHFTGLAVGTNTTRSWYLRLDITTGLISFLWYVDGTTAITLTSSAGPTLNTWSHIAVTRTSGTTRIFLNGVQVASASTQSGAMYSNVSAVPTIGREAGFNGSYFIGYISNVRIVNGAAVYTNNFTPPTAPLTAITNTSLLTCQSPTIIDTSTNKFTITNNGTAVVSASVTPF